MVRKVLFATVGLLLFPAADVSAQETVHWRDIGQWQIRIDRTLDYGCFMLASYTKGTVLRVGMDQQNRNGYVLIGNDAWKSLVPGNQYDLALQFDRDRPWRGRARARKLGTGSMVFLQMAFTRPQFLVDFARRSNMTVLYNGRVVTSLPLIGTRAATQGLLECQRIADMARTKSAPPRDPFAGGRKPNPDPFDGSGGGVRRPDQSAPTGPQPARPDQI